VKRLISPSTNATGLGAAVAGIYAAVVMIWNAAHGHGVIDAQVLVAAVGAAAFLYTRFRVTPIADPRDGNGNPLVSAVPGVPAVPAPPSNVTVIPGQPAPPPANGPRM
jgi:hypothetical protein